MNGWVAYAGIQNVYPFEALLPWPLATKAARTGLFLLLVHFGEFSIHHIFVVFGLAFGRV